MFATNSLVAVKIVIVVLEALFLDRLIHWPTVWNPLLTGKCFLSSWERKQSAKNKRSKHRWIIYIYISEEREITTQELPQRFMGLSLLSIPLTVESKETRY